MEHLAVELSGTQHVVSDYRYARGKAIPPAGDLAVDTRSPAGHAHSAPVPRLSPAELGHS